MAKVVLPLLSVEASGSVGKAITYRATGNGTTVARYKKQRDASSTAQVVQRTLFLSAVESWPEVCESARDVSAEWAQPLSLNAWNWFLRLVLRQEIPVMRIGDCFVGDFRRIG